jgi:hypothetical protein
MAKIKALIVGALPVIVGMALFGLLKSKTPLGRYLE